MADDDQPPKVVALSRMTPADLLAEADFVPTQRQLLIKARFWDAARDTPVLDPESVTLAQATQMSSYNGLREWWGNACFRMWFLNRRFVEEQLQVAAEMAVDALRFLLDMNNRVTDNTRIAAVKLALEYTNRAPAKSKEKVFADKDIEAMNEDQLKDFIRKATKLSGGGG